MGSVDPLPPLFRRGCSLWGQGRARMPLQTGICAGIALHREDIFFPGARERVAQWVKRWDKLLGSQTGPAC